jgi:hypothetical protein
VVVNLQPVAVLSDLVNTNGSTAGALTPLRAAGRRNLIGAVAGRGWPNRSSLAAL